MKTIVLISVLASSLASAQVLDSTAGKPNVPKEDPPYFAPADFSGARLESLRTNGAPLRAQELQQVRSGAAVGKVESRSGGDDVGNGGDEVRYEFLELVKEMLPKLSSGSLRSQLEAVANIRHLVVVEGLGLQSAREAVSVKSYVSEGIIFLDALAWSTSDGLLSRNVDPRFEVLKLLAEAAGGGVSLNILLQQWHGLDARSGKIWCPLIQSRQQLKRVAVDVAKSDVDASNAELMAMAECRAQHLVDCRVASTIRRGRGAGWVTETTVRGWREAWVNKSAAQLKQGRCDAIRACEQVHEWAPNGQVSPAAYLALDQASQQDCR